MTNARDLYLKGLKNKQISLSDIPKNLQMDDEICLEAVKINWRALNKVPIEKRRNLEICRNGIQQNWEAFEFFPDEIKAQLYKEEIQKNWERLKDVPIEYCTLSLCTEAFSQNLDALEFFPEPILKTHINETIKILRDNPHYLEGIRLSGDIASKNAAEAIFSQGAMYYKYLLIHISKKKLADSKKYNFYEEIISNAINRKDINSYLTSFFMDDTLQVNFSDLLKYVKKHNEINWSETSFFILNSAYTNFSSRMDTQSLYKNFPKETIYDWILIAINNNQFHILKDLINKNEITFDELLAQASTSSKQPELIEKLNAKKYFIQNKGIAISQDVIRENLRIFLKGQPGIHDYLQAIRDFENKLDIPSGHCTSLTFLFLYGKYLETQPQDNKKARDDNEWLFTTLYQVASWDRKKNTLTSEKILVFERLIALMQAYQQGFNHLFGISMGPETITTMFSDTKNRQLKKETSLAAHFNGQALASVIPELIKKNSLVYISSVMNEQNELHKHATGIFYTGQYYYFYNSNFEDGVRVTTDINELTAWVFESYKFNIDSHQQFAFNHYGFSPDNQPINHQAILDKSYLSSDLHNIKSLYKAIEINSIDSVKYFLEKVDINIEHKHSTLLSFALSYSGPHFESNEAIISCLINKGAIRNASVQLRAKYLDDSAEFAYNPAYIKLVLNELKKINALGPALNEKFDYYLGNTLLHTVLDKNFPSDVIIMMLEGGGNLMAKNKKGETPLKYIIDKHEQYADVLAYCITHKPNEIVSVINQAIVDNQNDQIRPIFTSLKKLSFNDVAFKEIYNKLSSDSKYTVIRECNIAPPAAPTQPPSLKSRKKFFPTHPPVNTNADHPISHLSTTGERNKVINKKTS